MSESTMQFRVGLLVIVCLMIGVGLIFQFGELRWIWESQYPIELSFNDAPGVQVGTPVRRNGLVIGVVRHVALDDTNGGVLVSLNISEKHRLRKDTQARLMVSLLGDASIEFTAGKSLDYLQAGERISGEDPVSPMEIIARVESKATSAIESFTETSQEWQQVAKNVNRLLENNRGELEDVVAEAAVSLKEFTLAMKSINSVISKPEQKQALEDAILSLATISRDASETIQSIRQVVDKMDRNLANLEKMTQPLARHSASILTKIDRSASNLESFLAEADDLVKILSSSKGTLRRLAEDPTLYKNMNRSAEALAILLENMSPILRDAQILADRLARHPELLGVSGVVQGSSGVKPSSDKNKKVIPASSEME